jgi:hypothetical protein
MAAAAPSDEAGGERTTPVEDTHDRLACLEDDDGDNAVVATALLDAATGAVPLRRLLRLGPPTNLNSRGVWTWAMVKGFRCFRVSLVAQSRECVEMSENAWRGN